MDLEAMYQEIILDHYRNPQGKGLTEPFDSEVHHINPTCGDEITVRLRLSADGSTIESLVYDGQGCSISQASASVLHDLVTGLPVARALDLEAGFRSLMHGRGAAVDDTIAETLGDAVAFTGVAKYPARIKCALLAWMAMMDALGRAGIATTPGEVSPS